MMPILKPGERFIFLCPRCRDKGLTECESHIPKAMLDAMIRPEPFVFIMPGWEARREYLHTTHADLIDSYKLSRYEFLYLPKYIR